MTPDWIAGASGQGGDKPLESLVASRNAKPLGPRAEKGVGPLGRSSNTARQVQESSKNSVDFRR
jgi:hypothetical protein